MFTTSGAVSLIQVGLFLMLQHGTMTLASAEWRHAGRLRHKGRGGAMSAPPGLAEGPAISAYASMELVLQRNRRIRANSGVKPEIQFSQHRKRRQRKWARATADLSAEIDEATAGLPHDGDETDEEPEAPGDAAFLVSRICSSIVIARA